MLIMGGEWEKFEKGILTEEQLKKKIESDHGIAPALMEKMVDDWRATLRPAPKTINIAKKLKSSIMVT